MIKLVINKEGKFDLTKSRANLRQGEQYFRNIQITIPKKIQCIDISDFDVKLLIKKNREKFVVDLNLKVQAVDSEEIKYYQDIFPGLSNNANELELGIMWIKGEKQYISNIIKVKIDRTLLTGEIRDISEFLEEYKLEVESIMDISKQVKDAEFHRIENENNRIKEESNREVKFTDWINKFSEFIENNEIYSINENQRIEKMNAITNEWKGIKLDLSSIDIIQLSNIVSGLVEKNLNHVKNISVNVLKNTLDIYFEKDSISPSLSLDLPKGFSGDYNDLINKPNLSSNVKEIDRKTDSIGTYIVYSNGIAEYIGYQSVNVNIGTSYGSLFTGEYNWEFPIKFSSRPAVSVTDAQWTSGASWGIPQLVNNRLTSTKIKLLDITTRSSSEKTRLGIYVRGLVDINNYKI